MTPGRRSEDTRNPYSANPLAASSPCAPATRCNMLTSDSSRFRTQSMHRLVARLLLLVALAGNLIPLALAATIAPRHACCVRKAAHSCHGSSAADAEKPVIRNSGCCRQDCSRAVAFSKVGLGRHSAGFCAPSGHGRLAEAPSIISVTTRRARQSTRAPPQFSSSIA
jgi:hypothetical protein